MSSKPIRYQVGGCLPPTAETYIQRQADRDLLRLLREHEFCIVLNSRQMGKSSLRVQTSARLKTEGFICVSIDLTTVGGRGVTEVEFYQSFLSELIDGLGIETEVLSQWWQADSNRHLSLMKKVDRFIDRVVLAKIQQPIVIFIDEVDSTLNLDFSLDDFWAWMKSCYDKRANDPKYRQITFVLLGVTTPNDLCNDIVRSPLNVGVEIDLKGFETQDITGLVPGLGKSVNNPESFLSQIHHHTGGQPFLTQKVFKLIQDSQIETLDDQQAIENLIRDLIVSDWENQDRPQHLRTIRDRMVNSFNSVDLLFLYEKICQNGEIDCQDRDRVHQELLLSGLVIKQGSKLRIQNEIYKKIFNRQWTKEQLKNKGFICGRYRIVKQIGQGGFGKTFLVEDFNIPNHPKRVLKKLSPANDDRENITIIKRYFERETVILEDLRLESVPRLYDYFEEDCEFYHVQEYVEGETLEAELNKVRGNIDETEVIETLNQILRILASIHNLRPEPLIHRDIKPSNIIRRDDDKLVLIDFGIAVKVSKARNSNQFTVIGTPGYAPPEQWEGNSNPRSDIYALGMVGIQALTSQLPIHPNISSGDNPNWTTLKNSGVSSKLQAILRTMTELEIDKRYQSAQEVLDALAQLRPRNTGYSVAPPSSSRGVLTILSQSTKFIIPLMLSIVGLWSWTHVSGWIKFVSNNSGTTNPTTSPSLTVLTSEIENDSISTGDRPIVLYESDKQKQNEGTSYFKSGNYIDAYKAFFTQIKNKKLSDPALMIFMNNAKVRYLHQQHPDKPIYTIAVAVPTDTPVGKRILYGVALAQNKVVNPENIPSGSKYPNLSPDIEATNSELDFPYLEIVITNDKKSGTQTNSEKHQDYARKLAEKLIKPITGEDGIQRDTKSIIGSYTSEITCAALPVYSEANMPMLSPTSSLNGLGSIDNCKDPNKVHSRTITSSEFEAERLINKLTEEKYLQEAKITAFYKKGKLNEFSQDLFNLFTKKLSAKKLSKKIDKEYNLSDNNDYKKIIKDIQNSSDKNVIILFPDGGSKGDTVFDNAQEVINNIDPNKTIMILGSNPLLEWSDNIPKLQALHKKIFVAVDWSDDSNCSNKEFVEYVKGTIGGGFNRHLVSSYEATMALVEIYNNGARTREEIKNKSKYFTSSTISDPYRNTKVGFDTSGNRTGINHKILLTPSSKDTEGSIFKPLLGECNP